MGRFPSVLLKIQSYFLILHSGTQALRHSGTQALRHSGTHKTFLYLYNTQNHDPMKVETKGHTCIIKDNHGDLTGFLMKLTHEYKTFEKHNIVADVTSCSKILAKDLNAFLPLAKIHKKVKKSFV